VCLYQNRAKRNSEFFSCIKYLRVVSRIVELVQATKQKYNALKCLFLLLPAQVEYYCLFNGRLVFVNFRLKYYVYCGKMYQSLFDHLVYEVTGHVAWILMNRRCSVENGAERMLKNENPI